LWNRKRESALIAYQQAWDEFESFENADVLRTKYFGKPVLLPDMPFARRTEQTPGIIKGYVDVSYSVNKRGRVKNLTLVGQERVDEDDETEPDGLLRQLRQQLYRPALEDGVPVDTEMTEKRYAY